MSWSREKSSWVQTVKLTLMSVISELGRSHVFKRLGRKRKRMNLLAAEGRWVEHSIQQKT